MDTHEERIAAYEAELRAKYNADELKKLGEKGHALKNANGDWSYPINDADDLAKAIHAVGSGGSDHDTIRAHIIKCAKKLGEGSKIPDGWNADGSLKQENSEETDAEERAKCATCNGTGSIMDGHRKCPDCKGTGVEARNKPTPEDYEISRGLSEVKMMLAGVKAKQLADPDYKTDPDDEAVMSHIEAAEGALDQAIIAQSKDGHREKGERNRNRRRKGARHRAVSLGREVRHWPVGELEVRSDKGTGTLTIEGAPIVYGKSYTVRDHFGEFEERMHPGCATQLLKRGVDCRLLLNHEGMPMARTTSGTLHLWDTPKEMRFKASLDSRQQLATDFAIAIERRDISQMSVGMIVGKDKWGQSGGTETRDVYGLEDLLDVSGVTYPCSPSTNIEMALRAVLEAPVESHARLRNLEVAMRAGTITPDEFTDLLALLQGREIRAGKTLSDANKQKVGDAITALHALYAAGGGNPRDLIDDDDEELVPEDGSVGSGGSGDSDAYVAPDGSGTRTVDPGEKMRSASMLRLQVEARKRRRIAA
jgi:HK97 family phage prohead protease